MYSHFTLTLTIGSRAERSFCKGESSKIHLESTYQWLMARNLPLPWSILNSCSWVY